MKNAAKREVHMKTAVRYYSRSGNTEKIADAIAKEAEVRPETVGTDLTEPVELLFLGSSLYKFTYEPSVGAFLKRNADRIGKVALFGTSASGKSTYPKLKPLLDALQIPLCEVEFVCLGKFLFANKGRPNEADVAAAAAFAKSVLKQP